MAYTKSRRAYAKEGAALLALFTVLFGYSIIGCDDMTSTDTKNNETNKNARQLTANSWQDSTITASGSEQWFKFTASANTQYIHIRHGMLSYLYVQLCDSNGNPTGQREQLIQSQLNGATGWAIERTVTAGVVYCIKVTQYESYTGTFQITVGTSPVAFDTLNGAAPLYPGSWGNGSITSTAREQWFTFTANASSLNMHIKFGTLTDLYVQLYDSNGGTLGDRTELYSSKTYTSLTIVSGQVYYIKVTPYSSYSGTYQIGFNTSPLPPGTLDGATPLSEGAWTNGAITSTTSVQWFSFIANANPHYLHIKFSTLTDVYVRLYTDNGSELGNDIELYSSIKKTSLIVTPGDTYYIRVRPYSSYGSGTYQIAFNASENPPN